MESYDSTSPVIHINERNVQDLRETAKWARFLSILGFVFCGLMLVMAFFIGSFLARMQNFSPNPMTIMAPFLSVVYVIAALIYFFPCLYLFRFATQMLRGINTTDQALVDSSLGNLKSCFKYIGILTLVCLILYALGVIFVVVTRVAMSH